MIIDNESFTQIALHIRRASDGLLSAARQISTVCDPQSDRPAERGDLMGAVESLVSMNEEFMVLEQLLRAIWEANRSENRTLS